MKQNKKAHWEQVYQTKNADQVSWTQDVPEISLNFIRSFNLSKNAKIIDIGGGGSNLVDFLLQEEFTDITVLDISEAALEKSQNRLGEKGKRVKWIVSDIIGFEPNEKYDLWHDRATFHFLTGNQEITNYLNIAGKAVAHYMVIGSFSETGPEQCSGLPVRQYSERQLQNELRKDFKKLRCIHTDHITPFHTIQNFLFCSFKKRDN